MQIVIPSRSRQDTIGEGALKIFPKALVCVAESERDAYHRVTKNLLLHPDEVTGIGPLRQWILDNVNDEVVVQCDDDVHTVYSLVGFTKRNITNLTAIERIVYGTAQCAIDAKCSVFGFNQAWDVRKYKAMKPFAINSWAGGVIGFVGRKHRYDVNLTLRADIDFCLQCLLKDRIVWIENRYSFVHRRWVGQGGNAANRSESRHEAEIAYLQKKWGRHLSIQAKKHAVRLAIHIER